jgi:hypothetical protein
MSLFVLGFIQFDSPSREVKFQLNMHQLTCGLYYKHAMLVNGASSSIIKWSFKLIDAARGIIYDRHMFIVLATMPKRVRGRKMEDRISISTFGNWLGTVSVDTASIFLGLDA